MSTSTRRKAANTLPDRPNRALKRWARQAGKEVNCPRRVTKRGTEGGTSPTVEGKDAEQILGPLDPTSFFQMCNSHGGRHGGSSVRAHLNLVTTTACTDATSRGEPPTGNYISCHRKVLK